MFDGTSCDSHSSFHTVGTYKCLFLKELTPKFSRVFNPFLMPFWTDTPKFALEANIYFPKFSLVPTKKTKYHRVFFLTFFRLGPSNQRMCSRPAAWASPVSLLDPDLLNQNLYFNKIPGDLHAHWSLEGTSTCYQLPTGCSTVVAWTG